MKKITRPAWSLPMALLLGAAFLLTSQTALSWMRGQAEAVSAASFREPRMEPKQSLTAGVPSPPFTVRNYGGKCLALGPPKTFPADALATVYSVFISACNGSAAQQVRVQEINDRREVVLWMGDGVIGSAADQIPLEVQPYTGAPGQIFALDGDSIILASDRNLVVEAQNNRGANRTPVALGRRDLDDSEFWSFAATDGSARKPTSGFVRISQSDNSADGELRARADFLDAVYGARWGSVIELDPNVSLNLADTPPLPVPAGVTIRGGRRGASPGPLLAAKSTQNQPPNPFFPQFDGGMLIINGDQARITGLRMQGPTSSLIPGSPYANGIVAPDQFISIIDHNEMFDWTASAVNVSGVAAGENVTDHRSPSTRPQKVRVARNFMHHNQMWSEGYGVVTYSGYPSIEGNTFLSNRHAIAASNNAFTGYTASFNLVLSASPDYKFLGFSPTPDFDMHGTLNEGCQYCGGKAGWYAGIAGNTFLGANRANFTLRGTPGYLAEFNNNISLQSYGTALLIRGEAPLEKLTVVGNHFSAPNPTNRVGAGDFDGDGQGDLFLATGAAWYYAPAGVDEWRFINAQLEKIGDLLFGDFDNDGRTDVFMLRESGWFVSWGGASKWEKIIDATEPISNWRFLDRSYDGGNGPSDGSFSRPYTSFNDAVAKTPEGGTIWLLRTQTIPAVGTYGKRIAVKAAPGVEAILGG